ncbi:MAG: hypothetical protein ACRCTE_03295 [Cellulosilyticaceae bacterium]
MRVVIRIKFNVPYTQFNNPFNEERLTQNWIAYRLSVFMKYTYVSLVRQYNQNFRAFIQYDPASWNILRQELAKYPRLNSNIIFTPHIEGKMVEYIRGDAYFCLVYLDSDNMLSPQFVESLYREPVGNTEVLIHTKGYVYEETTRQVGVYSYPAPDTFYALIYPSYKYLSGFRYQYPANQYGDVTFGGHLLDLNYKKVEKEMYMIILHGHNVSHNLEYMKSISTVQKMIDNPYEKSRILSDYGIF